VNFLSRLAIPGLIRYVVMLTALVYLLNLLRTPIVEFIYLDPALVFQGQIWRLFTWILMPPPDGMLGMLGFFIYLWFTWWNGDLLEASWGTVRLNLYYFLGMAGITVAALFFGVSFGNMALNLSLFLALATIAPDLEILLFFIFPVKIKWLAIFSVIWAASIVLFGNLATQAALLVCFANYLLFFGRHLFQQARTHRQEGTRRARFEAAKREPDLALHRCETCGITEQTHPDADFRVTGDGREYCTAHLPKG
jgi:hypothetical protein